MLKEKTVTINDNGNPLQFKIKQLTATQQEELIVKALLLLANKELGDMDVNDLKNYRLNTKALISALEKLDYTRVKELSDILLGCCYRVVGKMEERCTPETVDGYIEEFRTLLTLKKEAFSLSFDFFQDAGNSQEAKPAVKLGRSTQM